MTRTRNMADLLDSSGDIKSGRFDNLTIDVVSDTTPQLGGNLDTNGNDINFGDNDKAQFGAGSDFEIRHNSATGENLLNLTSNPLEMHQAGVNSVLELHNDGTNHNQVLQILKGGTLHGSISTDTGKLKIDGAGSLELSDGGSTKLATTSTGIDVTGTVTADGLTVGAGDQIKFGGTAFDYIAHDSSNNAGIIKGQC